VIKMARIDTSPYKKLHINDFEKIALFVGTIADIKRHPKSDKHYILEIDCLAQDEEYQTCAPLAKSYSMANLLGKQVLLMANVKPINILGVESNCMILCARKDKKHVLITTDKKVPNGAKAVGLYNGERMFKE
jgi:methionine--tRNA ligase beta chain